MNQVASAQTEFDALNNEYGAYITELRTNWLTQNRVESGGVYEVTRPEERAKVHRRIAQWGRYITPLAEAWWKERGYGVIWPAHDSEPMKVYKLEAA